MKITDKKLEFEFELIIDDEVIEFITWCMENKNIIHSFRIAKWSSTNNITGTIEFKEDESAIAFKLRWL